ncbi:uncharacterized protein LOC127265818 [Andrographis paniculata]|uniref:uncharacterized protein LOC127265818 n=1 Tax=Andrographis paniculata TaxID=175694 RepID=UPI0021E7384C|nr:uncharacterized protein LOC127265818 [Andrographis paniculata]
MLIAPAAAVATRRRAPKSNSRVADENLGSTGGRSESTWKHKVSFLCDILLAPLSMLSCLSHPYMSSAADGVWVSAELPHTSEVTHLMVRDSLRYAILM